MTPARRLGLLTRHPQAVEGETHNPLIPPARRPRASGGAATGMLSALTVPTRRPQTVGGAMTRLSDLMTVTVLSAGWEVEGL